MHALPSGSATFAKDNELPRGATLTDLLLADLYATWTGEHHPLVEPILKRANAAKHHAQVVALRDHARRMAARQARLDAARPASHHDS